MQIVGDRRQYIKRRSLDPAQILQTCNRSLRLLGDDKDPEQVM